ncbi:hypothetical protein V8F06_012508 [Rhypophila decipiens]
MMPTQSIGKRAACDRCHALKMRCVVTEEDPADVGGSRGLAQGHRRCNRCHSARVACNYSSPGKPGRPPTKNVLPGASTDGHTHIRQRSGRGLETLTSQSTRRQSMSATTASTLVSPNQDYISSQFDFGILSSGHGASGSKSPPSAAWCDVLALAEDDEPLEGQYTTPMLSWSSDTADSITARGTEQWMAGEQRDDLGQEVEDMLCFPTGEEFGMDSQEPYRLDHSHAHATASEASSEQLSSTSTQPVTVSTTTSTASYRTGYDGTHYLQRLSEFNTGLSSPIVGLNGLSPTSPDHSTAISRQPSVITTDQLEQAAKHVLQSSALFLDLLQFPSSLADKPTPDPSEPAPPPVLLDMAARLQLLVSYMRLTELHHGLYSAVYNHLQHQQQRQQAGSAQSNAEPAAAERPAEFSLSVAGVSLTAIRGHPRFQLQLLLQTSAHYLGCIQEELDLPTPLRVNGLFHQKMSPTSTGKPSAKASLLGQRGSAEAALLVHTLMMHDQEPKLQRINEVLDNLRKDFGIVVIYGAT